MSGYDGDRNDPHYTGENIVPEELRRPAWEMVSVFAYEGEFLRARLEAGWEPFAVGNTGGLDVVYLRRQAA